MKKNIFLRFWPHVFSVLFLYLLFRELKDYNFVKNLSQISWQILLFSLVMFFVIKFINTWRYSKVYQIKKTKHLFLGLSFCNLMLTLIPFRLGEYSYIQYFENNFQIKKIDGTRKLALIRIFDYIIVYTLFILSSFFVSLEMQGKAVFYVSIFTFVGLIFGLILIGLILKVDFIENKIFNKIKKMISDFRGEVNLDKKFLLFQIFISTVFYWLTRLFMGFVIFNLLGIEINLAFFIFISLFLLLIGLLPIKTFAGFGIFEGGWTYFLVLIGFNYQDVLPIIINFHILLLLPAVVYGIVSWLSLKFLFKK